MGSRSFTLFESIGKVPLLSREEEVELSKKIKKGDQAARDKMIKANLRLALSIVKKYLNRGVEADDLLQESIIGLTKAVDQFDHTLGFKFSTYAYWWIQQAVRQSIAENSGPITLPANTFSKLYKVSVFEKEFQKKNDRKPTDEEIADHFGTTADTLQSLRQSASFPASFDTPMGSEEDGGSRTLRDIIPSDADLPDEMLDNERLNKVIRESLGNLTERERLIISMRFGIDLESPQQKTGV